MYPIRRSLRFTLDVLLPRLWRKNARLRLTRPLAVNLKRFLALLLDFIFNLGMRGAEYIHYESLRKMLVCPVGPQAFDLTAAGAAAGGLAGGDGAAGVAMVAEAGRVTPM